MPHNNTGNGKFKLLKIVRGKGVCLGYVGSSKEIVCVNSKCTIGSHKKALMKWELKADFVLLVPALKQGKSHTAFVIPGSVVVGDDLPSWMVIEAELQR